MKLTKNFIRQNKGKRFNLTLSDGVRLTSIGFIIENDTIKYLGAKQKKNGNDIPNEWNIIDIEPIINKITPQLNAKRLLTKIHPDTWNDFKVELEGLLNGKELTYEFITHFDNKTLSFRKIKPLLPEDEFKRLSKAFDSKEPFKYNHSAERKCGRDIVISCNVCKDGIYRGYMCSTNPVNNVTDWYLILNPRYAVYYEREKK